jgi:hypothetical protein
MRRGTLVARRLREPGQEDETMKLTRRFAVALTAFALMVGSASFVTAQQPPPDPAPAVQEQEAHLRAEGELIRVDTDTNMLTIRTEDGTEMEFSYTEDTEIIGALEGAAGLATETGSEVTVHYAQDGDARKAVRVEVTPAS